MRDEDETGISGTGVVAFGVVFSDGVTVTRWNSDVAQTCVWQSFDEVDAVHGHGGRTRIEWVDALEGRDDPIIDYELSNEDAMRLQRE